MTVDLQALRTLASSRELNPEQRGMIYLALPFLVEAVEALAVAADLLDGEDYPRDPDYRQEWKTIADALAPFSEETE